jgi:arylsulfatase A-like enzyme
MSLNRFCSSTLQVKAMLVFAMVSACVADTAIAQPTSKSDSKPNIVFIFADDQSFASIAELGNTDVETPNLDRLARRGTTFTHAFNMGSWSGAVCVASRTMLNSGRFVWDANAIYDQSEQERREGRWWSEYMKAAGYRTYMTGKWHCKANAEAAFDVARDIRPGMPKDTPEGYDRPAADGSDPWSPSDPKFGGFWEGGTHWSEVVANHADEFLSEAAQRAEPFFMYLAFNAPHDPRQSPKQYVAKYPLESIKVPASFLPVYPYADEIGCGKSLRDEKLGPFPRTEHSIQVHRQEYYAIITHMDEMIGRILDAIEATGKADNTWIFFTADHGLSVGHHGLMGKQNMYDDSVRVPLIVAGPSLNWPASSDQAMSNSIRCCHFLTERSHRTTQSTVPTSTNNAVFVPTRTSSSSIPMQKRYACSISTPTRWRCRTSPMSQRCSRPSKLCSKNWSQNKRNSVTHST